MRGKKIAGRSGAMERLHALVKGKNYKYSDLGWSVLLLIPGAMEVVLSYKCLIQICLIVKLKFWEEAD